MSVEQGQVVGQFEGKGGMPLSRRTARVIAALLLGVSGACGASSFGRENQQENQQVIAVREGGCKNPPPPQMFCPGGIPSIDCFPYGGSVWDPLCDSSGK